MKTTAEKINVMLAYERGETIEVCCAIKQDWSRMVLSNPVWDWHHTDYRVAKAAPKTVKKSIWLGIHKDGRQFAYWSEEHVSFMRNQPDVFAIKRVEVEFVEGEGLADENATVAEKSNIPPPSEAAPSFEDGSPQLEVERLNRIIEDMYAQRIKLRQEIQTLETQIKDLTPPHE